MLNILPDLYSRKMVVILGPHAAQDAMIELAAGLARRGPLRVMDGGNQFNAYRLARTLRRRTVEIHAALDRVSLSRAFTCYQMETMLATSPAQPSPVLVFDLLATFYDENVSMPERRRLLSQGVRHLRRLSRLAPIAVGARPALAAARDAPERVQLLEILQESADQVWEQTAPGLPAPPQLRLF